jgi:hypothetical protein
MEEGTAWQTGAASTGHHDKHAAYKRNWLGGALVRRHRHLPV